LSTSWTIRSALKWAHSQLRREGVDEARLSAEALLAHALGTERLTLYLQPERGLPAEAMDRFQTLIQRRSRGAPVQHLVGEVSFMGHPLSVNGSALVPRFETEQLVERALARLPVTEGVRFLDAGTGSGAIAIALAKARPDAVGVALDRSSRALDLARRNAERNGVADRLSWVASDWLDGVEGAFHLIVSNPPYVRSDALAGLAPEVRHDPPEALDGGPDGLAAYRALIPQAASRLAPGGWLVLEIGEEQGPAVRQLLERTGYAAVGVLPDLSGTDRFAEARWEGRCHGSSKSRS